MKRLLMAFALATAVAGCRGNATSSGPGSASLDVAGTSAECRSIGGCVYLARLNGPTGVFEADFEHVASGGEPRALGINVAGSDVACLMYTSGTTGQPKGASAHEN